MTAGSAVNELLYPSQVRSRAAELHSGFDFVLIDTPSILSSGDACLLAQGTDGAILVVRFNMTRRESARKAKEGLEAAGVWAPGGSSQQENFSYPGAHLQTALKEEKKKRTSSAIQRVGGIWAQGWQPPWRSFVPKARANLVSRRLVWIIDR